MTKKKFSVLCCALAAAFAAASAQAAAPDAQCETVIVGAGGAGMRTAIALKEAGRDVILVEKLAFAGGATNLAATYMTVVGTKEQAAAGKVLSLDDYVARQKKINPNMNEKRIREVRGASQETLDWINALGANITRAISDYQVGTADGRSLGSTIVKAMKSKLDAVGVVPRYETRAVALLGDKTRVTGIVVKDKTGEYKISAKNVVLATGGFGANPEMVKKYNPKIDERFKTTDAPGTTGEALYMAERAGAQLVNMGYIQTYPICDPISGVIELIADARFDGAIMLNQEGKRFVEELQRRDVLSEAILKQTGGYCWVLWNDKIGSISNTVKEHPTEYEAFTKQGIMATCDDLKCVADFTKIPFDSLKGTIDRVSSMTGKGNDKDFNHRSGLLDMTQGKYYVIKAVPSVHHTMGGVRINEKAQALTAEGKAIPGLWAAGEVTGVTHGTNRLGGNAYTDIIVFGRIAGKAAAEAAK